MLAAERIALEKHLQAQIELVRVELDRIEGVQHCPGGLAQSEMGLMRVPDARAANAKLSSIHARSVLPRARTALSC